MDFLQEILTADGFKKSYYDLKDADYIIALWDTDYSGLLEKMLKTRYREDDVESVF